ncbi:hypothetical protein QBC38DRAFT_536185 [Podospora fimiseda]|uniref:Zn(2)-C6 fungal-type domain-containing protein n=1 Tax=Podospora fimiseda TaxID=252190 RepID=A0AAN7BQV8_9PEZI|nr:hypothetical protein QBC38DRAFT_536185 [Podospora fimiseda]
MQRSHPGDDSWKTVGKHRGSSDLARSALSLDLNWARADSESAARQRSYPSPPMSGSPLLPKSSQEATERSLGGHQTTTQDAYRGIPATQGHGRTQTPIAAAPPRQFFTDAPERTPFHYPRLDQPPSQPLSYSQLPGQLAIEPRPNYLPNHPVGNVLGLPGPLSATQTYSTVHHQQSIEEPHQHPSPKQRKTKGHVASACVPCKKAHLRCTSQNKADQCIDVQHKKRGRPRLRDENQQRYGNPADIARRPLSSAYGPGSSMGMVSNDNLRRPHSYRVLKSQPAEPIRPRFPDRALGSLASDVNVIPPPPLSISIARPPEDLVAYLTLTPTLVFLKASGPFFNAIGRSSILRMPLAEVLVVADRIKPNRIADQLKEEQKRRGGTSMRIPPILTIDEQMSAVQNLGFTADRYALNWMEHLTFVGEDGIQRPFQVRMGLASEDSISFVVLLLLPPPPPRGPYQYQYPTPSPNPRESTYPTYQPSQSAYSQTTPQSATFDSRQSGFGDVSYGPRQGPPSGSLQHMPAGPSTGLPPTYSSSSHSRQPPPYPSASSSYQVPRSELQPASHPSLTAGLQLPPLSSLGPSSNTSQLQQELAPMYQSSREERPRVDIGGLIQRPDPPPPPNPPQ